MTSVNDIKTWQDRIKCPMSYTPQYDGMPAWEALKATEADLRAYAEQLDKLLANSVERQDYDALAAERDSYKTAAELAVESQNQAQSDAERAEKRVAELRNEVLEEVAALHERFLGRGAEVNVGYMADSIRVMKQNSSSNNSTNCAVAQISQPVGAVVVDEGKKYLTIVHDVSTARGMAYAKELLQGSWSAASWSHALNDRDDARAALAAQTAAPVAAPAAPLDISGLRVYKSQDVPAYSDVYLGADVRALIDAQKGHP